MIEPQRFAPPPASLTYLLSTKTPCANACMLHYASGGLTAPAYYVSAPEDGSEEPATLEDTARQERDYLRARLRDELKREPSEEELNEWLRQHTEGY